MSKKEIDLSRIKEEETSNDSVKALDLVLPGCSEDPNKNIQRSKTSASKSIDLRKNKDQVETATACKDDKANNGEGKGSNKDFPVYLAQTDRFSILNLLDLHGGSSSKKITSQTTRRSAVGRATSHIHDTEQKQFKAFLSSGTSSKYEDQQGIHSLL